MHDALEQRGGLSKVHWVRWSLWIGVFAGVIAGAMVGESEQGDFILVIPVWVYCVVFGLIGLSQAAGAVLGLRLCAAWVVQGGARAALTGIGAAAALVTLDVMIATGIAPLEWLFFGFPIALLGALVGDMVGGIAAHVRLRRQLRSS